MYKCTCLKNNASARTQGIQTLDLLCSSSSCPTPKEEVNCLKRSKKQKIILLYRLILAKLILFFSFFTEPWVTLNTLLGHILR